MKHSRFHGTSIDHFNGYRFHNLNGSIPESSFLNRIVSKIISSSDLIDQINLGDIFSKTFDTLFSNSTGEKKSDYLI